MQVHAAPPAVFIHGPGFHRWPRLAQPSEYSVPGVTPQIEVKTSPSCQCERPIHLSLHPVQQACIFVARTLVTLRLLTDARPMLGLHSNRFAIQRLSWRILSWRISATTQESNPRPNTVHLDAVPPWNGELSPPKEGATLLPVW